MFKSVAVALFEDKLRCLRIIADKGGPKVQFGHGWWAREGRVS